MAGGAEAWRALTTSRRWAGDVQYIANQLPALGVDCGAVGGGLAALKAAFVCTEEPADDEDVVGELLAGLERATTKRTEPLWALWAVVAQLGRVRKQPAVVGAQRTLLAALAGLLDDGGAAAQPCRPARGCAVPMPVPAAERELPQHQIVENLRQRKKKRKKGILWTVRTRAAIGTIIGKGGAGIKKIAAQVSHSFGCTCRIFFCPDDGAFVIKGCGKAAAVELARERLRAAEATFEQAQVAWTTHKRARLNKWATFYPHAAFRQHEIKSVATGLWEKRNRDKGKHKRRAKQMLVDEVTETKHCKAEVHFIRKDGSYGGTRGKAEAERYFQKKKAEHPLRTSPAARKGRDTASVQAAEELAEYQELESWLEHASGLRREPRHSVPKCRPWQRRRKERVRKKSARKPAQPRQLLPVPEATAVQWQLLARSRKWRGDVQCLANTLSKVAQGTSWATVGKQAGLVMLKQAFVLACSCARACPPEAAVEHDLPAALRASMTPQTLAVAQRLQRSARRSGRGKSGDTAAAERRLFCAIVLLSDPKALLRAEEHYHEGREGREGLQKQEDRLEGAPAKVEAPTDTLQRQHSGSAAAA